jgi:hypothetical protein
VAIPKKILRTSQNGWPASPKESDIDAHNYMIPGTGQHLKLASRGAPLLLAVAELFNREIEPVNAPGTPFDDWAYHYAPIPGQSVLSNHASGTAIDLNASKHIQGKRGTYPAAKIPRIRQICAAFGCRWGGDYKFGVVDEMHIELNISPAAADALILKLKLPKPKEMK